MKLILTKISTPIFESYVFLLLGFKYRHMTFGLINMQSEKSDDMFCDDIFGESPAGIRKIVSLLPIIYMMVHIFTVLLSMHPTIRGWL